MINPQLPLPLKHARHITKGHHDLTTLVAHFYLFGGEQYSGRESPEMTVRFLEMAPCTGDALYQLYKESNKTFEQFVADVIASKYLWHAIGQSLVLLIEIPFNLTRIMTRQVLKSVANPFNNFAPIRSE
ncbi:MAG: hypothetical protein HGB34_03115 [Candidatus Moranbacteria bacterium]|nr:hypothetical protein [Candidatus Moranbacteria bacterium]